VRFGNYGPPSGDCARHSARPPPEKAARERVKERTLLWKSSGSSVLLGVLVFRQIWSLHVARLKAPGGMGGRFRKSSTTFFFSFLHAQHTPSGTRIVLRGFARLIDWDFTALQREAAHSQTSTQDNML